MHNRGSVCVSITLNYSILVQVTKKTESAETVVNTLTAGTSFGVGYSIVCKYMTILHWAHVW